MKPVNDVLNSIRSKLKPRSIIILAVICVLIFPAVLIENDSIPTSDSHLYFLSMGSNSFPGLILPNEYSSGNSSANSQKTFFLLNNRLETVSNTTVRLNASVVDTNLLSHSSIVLSLYFDVTTGISGNFTLNNTVLRSHLPIAYNRTQNIASGYQIYNYTVLKSNNKPVPNQKDDGFEFSSCAIVVNNKTGVKGTLNMAFLPSYQLGYYGIAPVFFMSGKPDGSYNLSYHLYNPQNNNSVGSLVCLGNFSFNKMYMINSNEEPILSMNEAYNVTFFVNGTAVGIVYRSSFVTSFFSGISILGLLGNTGSEIMLLVTVFMVLMLFVPMFNPSVYRYYLSLPRKRWYTIVNEFISSLLAMSIFEGFAFVATYMISELVLHFSISGLAFAYIYLFSLAAFTVFASLYLLVGVYFIGKAMPKTFLTIFLVLGYPIIDSLSQTLFELQSLLPFYSSNSLFKPVLENIRTMNVISGILPVLNVEEMNSYFLRSPVSGVIMLNHLSIFDLSPIIFLSSIIGISVALFYLSIKRYYRY